MNTLIQGKVTNIIVVLAAILCCGYTGYDNIEHMVKFCHKCITDDVDR